MDIYDCCLTANLQDGKQKVRLRGKKFLDVFFSRRMRIFEDRFRCFDELCPCESFEEASLYFYSNQEMKRMRLLTRPIFLQEKNDIQRILDMSPTIVYKRDASIDVIMGRLVKIQDKQFQGSGSTGRSN